jgi:hypothetical protein
VHPLAVRPASNIVALLDLVAAARADLAWRLCLIVIIGLRGKFIRARLMLFRDDAEFLLNTFLDLGASEVWRSCHPGPFAGFERARCNRHISAAVPAELLPLGPSRSAGE